MACIYPTACCTSLPTKSLNTGISLTTILILSVAALLSTAAPLSCHECYQSFHYREKMQQSFIYHTHIEKSCYGTLIEKCVESGKSYYKVKNLEVSGSHDGAICPKGKQWLCCTKIGQRGVNTQVLEDIKREQIIAKAKAKTNNSLPKNHPRYFPSQARKKNCL
ncbi:suppressyn-like [Theropithecus gelada]|uniref:Suppressyn-like n=1 Tax=Theropithecus gelada TaxID=9565 RepID=A0A8D2EZ23_THEGE|nr:suppressyn-like [Theropithecus gelada]